MYKASKQYLAVSVAQAASSRQYDIIV